MEGELQVSYSCLFLTAKPAAWIRLTECSHCSCSSRNSSIFHWQRAALACLCAGTVKAEVGSRGAPGEGRKHRTRRRFPREEQGSAHLWISPEPGGRRKHEQQLLCTHQLQYKNLLSENCCDCEPVNQFLKDLDAALRAKLNQLESFHLAAMHHLS